MTRDLIFDFAAILVCAAWTWLSVRTTSCLRTITRGTARYTRRTVWLIKLVAIIVACSNIVGVAMSFGLHWLLSGLLGGVLVLFALTDKAAELTPPRPPQIASAYAQSWQEYSRLRRNIVLFVVTPLVLLLSMFALVVTLGTRLNGVVGTILFGIVACGITLSFAGYAYNGWQFSSWPCPRCGCRFRGWFPYVPRKKCSHCGLTLWDEHPDYPSSANR